MRGKSARAPVSPGVMFKGIKMLSEQQKNRIREIEKEKLIAKEEYECQTRKTKFALIKDFVNSSFGLWVLSTIIITVGWSSFLQYRVDIKKHEIVEERLNQEISNRLSILELHINNCLKKPTKCNPVNIFNFISQPTTGDNDYKSIFNEYQERGLISLMSEQHSVVTDEEKTEIISSLSNLSFVVKKYEKEKQTINNNELINLLKSLQENHDKNIYLKRWQPLYELF